MTHSIDLTGRTAIVTGASRGIGAATALLLAGAGADVIIGYKTRRDDAEAVALGARAQGVRATVARADISTEAGGHELIEAAHAAFGGIDILVGNAGVWPAEEVRLADMSTARWSETMRANLDSIFYTCSAAARVMSDGGRIVIVSSTAGQRGEAGHADYAASKGAVISLTKSIAIELAPRGINVNCVAPGWVDTEMTSGAFEGHARERIARSIPVGRIANADDIAGPILFLCSNLARHVTGEILNVNGGSVLCG